MRAEYGTFSLSPVVDGLGGTASRLRAYLFHLAFSELGIIASVAGAAALLWLVARAWAGGSDCGEGTAVADATNAASSATACGTTSTSPASSSALRHRVHTPVARMGVAVCVVLLLLWLLYAVVFSWLGRLPLHRPMAHGVFERFWMQPNVLAATLVGVAHGSICVLGGTPGERNPAADAPCL